MTRAEEETGLIEKADRPEARLGYRPPEEYADGGSKVGINRPSGRTGGREGIDGRSTLGGGKETLLIGQESN